MFFRQKPGHENLERLLAEHEAAALSYTVVGGTQGDAPDGYRRDRNRILIGHGLDAFKAAKAAVDDWKMFDLDWIDVFPARPAVNVGTVVAVVIRHLGFWSVNISRIVYVIAEESQYGFAYGTTLCHSETGEEQFLVEHDTVTDEVWYHLSAFSKPQHALARIGFPIARQLQTRFARESLAAMKTSLLVTSATSDASPP